MPTERQKQRIRRNQPKGAEREARAAATRRQRKPAYRAAWSGGVTGTMAQRALPFATLSEAPPALVERAWREKYPWIRRFVEERCPRGKLPQYAALAAQASGVPAEQIPPYTTLWTWAKMYREHGILGLIDKPRPEAGRSRTIVGPVAEQFTLFATLGHGATKILNEIAEALPGAPLPKRSAIYRALKRFEAENAHLVAMARMGPTWFRHVCEIALSHGVLAGGVRLTMDSTVADQFVRIPDLGTADGWRPVRPVLTIVEDVGSRALVTFNLALSAIDSGICLGVLGRAIDQRRNYPGLPSVGVPYEIAVDKGAEHLGQFQAALGTLGIAAVPREPDAPRSGAHVERLIQTVQTEVFSNLPGYSKTERVFDPYAPAERDAKRNLTQLKYEPFRLEVPLMLLPTLAQLEARILAWATVYNERPHRGLPANSPELQGVIRGVQRLLDDQRGVDPDAGQEAA